MYVNTQTREISLETPSILWPMLFIAACARLIIGQNGVLAKKKRLLAGHWLSTVQLTSLTQYR